MQLAALHPVVVSAQRPGIAVVRVPLTRQQADEAAAAELGRISACDRAAEASRRRSVAVAGRALLLEVKRLTTNMQFESAEARRSSVQPSASSLPPVPIHPATCSAPAARSSKGRTTTKTTTRKRGRSKQLDEEEEEQGEQEGEGKALEAPRKLPRAAHSTPRLAEKQQQQQQQPAVAGSPPLNVAELRLLSLGTTPSATDAAALLCSPPAAKTPGAVPAQVKSGKAPRAPSRRRKQTMPRGSSASGLPAAAAAAARGGSTATSSGGSDEGRVSPRPLAGKALSKQQQPSSRFEAADNQQQYEQPSASTSHELPAAPPLHPLPLPSREMSGHFLFQSLNGGSPGGLRVTGEAGAVEAAGGFDAGLLDPSSPGQVLLQYAGAQKKQPHQHQHQQHEDYLEVYRAYLDSGAAHGRQADGRSAAAAAAAAAGAPAAAGASAQLPPLQPAPLPRGAARSKSTRGKKQQKNRAVTDPQQQPLLSLPKILPQQPRLQAAPPAATSPVLALQQQQQQQQQLHLPVGMLLQTVSPTPEVAARDAALMTTLRSQQPADDALRHRLVELELWKGARVRCLCRAEGAGVGVPLVRCACCDVLQHAACVAGPAGVQAVLHTARGGDGASGCDASTGCGGGLAGAAQPPNFDPVEAAAAASEVCTGGSLGSRWVLLTRRSCVLFSVSRDKRNGLANSNQQQVAAGDPEICSTAEAVVAREHNRTAAGPSAKARAAVVDEFGGHHTCEVCRAELSDPFWAVLPPLLLPPRLLSPWQRPAADPSCSEPGSPSAAEEEVPGLQAHGENFVLPHEPLLVDLLKQSVSYARSPAVSSSGTGQQQQGAAAAPLDPRYDVIVGCVKLTGEDGPSCRLRWPAHALLKVGEGPAV